MDEARLRAELRAFVTPSAARGLCSLLTDLTIYVGAVSPAMILAAYPAAPAQVVQFRQILLWPIQLVPHTQGEQVQRHWELLAQLCGGRWTEVADEFTDDPQDFSERHYKEFVTFLPYVQRFLYGEAVRGGAEPQRPLRVFRRDDVTQARIRFPGTECADAGDVGERPGHATSSRVAVYPSQ